MFRIVDDWSALYGEAPLLLIRLRDDDELEAGLFATAIGAKASCLLDPLPSQWGFHTHTEDCTSGYASARGYASHEELHALLVADRHFAVPFRKPIASQGRNPKRISIGRSSDQDIVLRNETVSKFHAWLERSSDGAYNVADAGSRNGTRLNGRNVVRGSLPIAPGDALRFGAVEALVCSASDLALALSPECEVLGLGHRPSRPAGPRSARRVVSAAHGRVAR
jgi:FHA domain